MTLDGRGPGWNRNHSAGGRMHSCGRPGTPLGHLRIRRLGVRVAPGALQKDLVDGNFCPDAMGPPSHADHRLITPRDAEGSSGLGWRVLRVVFGRSPTWRFVTHRR